MPKKTVKDNRNRYQLREGMTLLEGRDTVIEGPEFVYLSLDRAFEVAHKLEEQDEIIAAVEKRRKEREKERRQTKRDKMFEAVGEKAPKLDEVGKE